MLFKNIHITDSAIHGNGLLAREPIKPGEEIYRVTGKIIEEKYAKDFSLHYPNWLGIGWEKWIIPDENNPMTNQNHSCSPNAIVDNQLNVTCIKEIDVNDEILIDYSTTELDPFWFMTCSCKHKNCRGLIKSFQFLDDSLKHYYQVYLNEEFHKWSNAIWNKINSR